MKRSILAVLLSLGLACAPGSEEAPAEAPAPVDDEAAVRTVAESWDPIMESGDLDGMMAIFVDDAVRLNAGEPPVMGAEAIRADFASGFESYTFDASNPIGEIGVAGDWAFAYGTYRDASTHKETGESEEEVGKWASVFRKTPAGWKYAIDIWNRDAPATSPEGSMEEPIESVDIPEASVSGAEAEAVRALADAWDTAFNAGDVDTLMTLYTTDARRMNADMPAVTGRDAIRAGFEADLAESTYEGSGPVHGLEVGDEWAYAWGTWSQTRSDQGSDEQFEESGNWLNVYKKAPDGWKIYLDFWNRDA